jgi:phage-related protein
VTKALKQIVFKGTSLDDLREFPEDARREAGHQLNTIQHGLNPDDYDPMPEIGQGAVEIRVKDRNGIYRVFYVAKFSNAIYVLHAFKKTTQQTSKRDIEIGRKQYAEVLKEQKELKEQQKKGR